FSFARSLAPSSSPSFFFFQAEDGIRDFHVTGVQTCALPISGRVRLDRQLLRGARLGARRAGGGARLARCGRGRFRSGELGSGVSAGGAVRTRLPAAAGRTGRRGRHPADAAGRGRSRVLAGLSQLLRDHALQPLADVFVVRTPVGTGDPRRGRARPVRRLLPLLAIALLAACAGTQKKPSGAAGAAVQPRVADSGPPPDCTGCKPYPPAQEDPST